MFARTPRLLLRPGWAEDIPALTRALSSGRLSPGPAVGNREAESFIARQGDALLPRLLVTLRTDSAPLVIGTIGLYSNGTGGIALTCRIAEEHRGKGYAAEAVRAMLDIAATLGLPKVEAFDIRGLNETKPPPRMPLAA